MNTLKGDLDNQQNTSQEERSRFTNCTFDLHTVHFYIFMHNGEAEKLSKTQVSFHLKSFAPVLMEHVCREQHKHTGH